MKNKSYVLLFLLILILIFIIGVRYGQKVEKTNKAINYLLSITPTQPVTVVPAKPLEFQNYTNKTCGISFLYPNSLTVQESSNSAVFSASNNEEQIKLSCDEKTQIKTIIADEDIATATAVFKNMKITVKNTNNSGVYIFKIVNPKNLKNIYVAVKKSLYPLFEKSLEFIIL
ncbi:MAG: hypothetical protein UX17_C0038G0004 [Parcubacteria group bacterium GW2011_GWC2_45_7]|uniref:Uncharacterized protein n=1 Tax=Candidatus Roizmanbacteria bacterium GW2011_GWA2_36_23 TaxID=1618480 RepID=A0A0G0EKR4_9BACT|nr:MAG: hypothetical protein US11_C0005G0021 [Candidatus Roizmanbacteria bacterium GW2011_GWA2_36_23]KKU12765.1 MAG: hypothetical protein UX17_C0038G0004 [Parcubacteria group bacterium GW2011_GWC2_45_7]